MNVLETTTLQGLEKMGITVPDSAGSSFRRYYEILTEKNKVMNLTSIEGEEETAQLHFLDCASVLNVEDLNGKTVMDIGTGAGFPGIVLKILCPDMKITLVDSQNKRILFLKEVCDLLELNDVECIHARAEELDRKFRASCDVVVSRAVAQLDLLCELSMPYVRQGGQFLSMKGPSCEEEVERAKTAVKKLGGMTPQIRKYTIPGTEVMHSIVQIKKDGITAEKYPRPWAQIKKHPLS